MGSISKCQKLNKQQNDKQCEDRISKLPSSLINHILSLLPTKYAVATSVLSTKWKQLWTLITSLDFDDKLLLHPEKSTDNSLQTCFANFVYRVLVPRRESCLRMFRLKGSQSFDATHVNTWVAVSLVCGVQELDLSIRIKRPTDHALPRDLFTSRKMVVLKLGTRFVMNVPTSVRMQSLKILHLHSVELIDDDSIYRLICGCPVLDELSMKGCVGKDVHVICIFAPVLTKLFIRPLVYYYHFDEVFKHKIVLDTPALLYLELETDSVEGYLVKNLSHLVTVNIGIGYWPKAENFPESVTDLFVGISSIQCLHAYSDFLVVLHQCNYHLPMFHNLTSLRLYMSGLAAWETMFWSLQKSPRLETLVFSNNKEYQDGEPRCWDQPQNVPKCLGSHLKVVEIFDLFEWEVYKEELKMVEYFLKNAEVLKKLIIHSGNLDFAVEKEKAKVKVLKKLLSFPRGSKVCQIVMR